MIRYRWLAAPKKLRQRLRGARDAAAMACLAAIAACSSAGEAIWVTPDGDIIRVAGDGALPSEFMERWQAQAGEQSAGQAPQGAQGGAFAFDVPPADTCWAADDQVIDWLSPDTIFYCGVISRPGVERFIEAVRGQAAARPVRLVIASAGGPKEWPLEMARFLQQAQFSEIVVAGPCFSGCAHFVFPAIDGRFLNPAAQLGLHNTASSIVRILERRGSEHLENPVNEPLRRRAAHEHEFLSQSGITLPESFLTDPQAMLGTKCMIPLRVDTTGEQIYGYESAFVLWSPDDAQWHAWGIGFMRFGTSPGQPPTNPAALGIAMNAEPLSRDTVRTFWRRPLPHCEHADESRAPQNDPPA
ncbi:hypothetical protein [Hyphomonas sp.]|uniref:hypothetical protein n=1 Tax=Hyphomonas sp. TaxID=87 RepID=UPI0039190A58